MEIKISDDEAVVLFELLSRFSEDSILGIEDQAEMRVLWNLQSVLESVLTEPFLQDYESKLADARNRLRDEGNLTNADTEQEKGRLALWFSACDRRFRVAVNEMNRASYLNNKFHIKCFYEMN